MPISETYDHLLELFAGTRSVSTTAQKLGFKTFSVDWSPFEGIDLIQDIGKLSTNDVPFVPDVIWASPDCTTYSIAAISKHRNGIEPKTDYAKKCDEVNYHVIGLIKIWQTLNPNLAVFIENPRGMFRKMPFVEGLIRHTVWYCKYGDSRAKPTDIFTNSLLWQPRQPCWNSNKSCHHEPSPRGSRTGTQGIKEKKLRSVVPKELVSDILKIFCKKC